MDDLGLKHFGMYKVFKTLALEVQAPSFMGWFPKHLFF